MDTFQAVKVKQKLITRYLIRLFLFRDFWWNDLVEARLLKNITELWAYLFGELRYFENILAK